MLKYIPLKVEWRVLENVDKSVIERWIKQMESVELYTVKFSVRLSVSGIFLKAKNKKHNTTKGQETKCSLFLDDEVWIDKGSYLRWLHTAQIYF